MTTNTNIARRTLKALLVAGAAAALIGGTGCDVQELMALAQSGKDSSQNVARTIVTDRIHQPGDPNSTDNKQIATMALKRNHNETLLVDEA